MTTHLAITIDSFTCTKYGVDAEKYRDSLRACEAFQEAKILVNHSNVALGGDFSSTAAIVHIVSTGSESGDHLFPLAQEIFQRLKAAA